MSAQQTTTDDDVQQEDIIDTLQTLRGIGPKSALEAVGRVNATDWTDLLHGDYTLKAEVRTGLRLSVEPKEVVSLIIRESSEYDTMVIDTIHGSYTIARKDEDAWTVLGEDEVPT